jgi:spore coat protein U-like protein
MMDFQLSTIRGLAAAAAIAAASISGSAQAAQAFTNLTVTATVTSNCSATTLPVAFGNVDTTSASNVDGTGRLSVTCTNGTSWTAEADVGAGTGATLAVRKMSAGANLLNYALYTDNTFGAIWGDGSGTTGTIGGTGNGTAQDIDIHGRVPSGQTSVPAGNYSDTVVVTVEY